MELPYILPDLEGASDYTGPIGTAMGSMLCSYSSLRDAPDIFSFSEAFLLYANSITPHARGMYTFDRTEVFTG